MEWQQNPRNPRSHNDIDAEKWSSTCGDGGLFLSTTMLCLLFGRTTCSPYHRPSIGDIPTALRQLLTSFNAYPFFRVFDNNYRHYLGDQYVSRPEYPSFLMCSLL